MSNQKNKKKKDRKPLIILIGFLLLFGVFVFFITRPSNQSLALKELSSSTSIAEVEIIWTKHKTELSQDEEFVSEIRQRISKFNPNEDEITQCIKWLPPAKSSINLILIPDLSRRITDSINNPNQIENDKLILSAIWNSFVSTSKLKQDTKDRLIVDVTDIDQAHGQFNKIANILNFDLSTHRGKSNRLYFDVAKDKLFKDGINEMYSLAETKPLGADYRFYLRRYLKNHLKANSLFDNFKNKVVIITDGYLEAEGKPADTKIKPYKNQLYKSVSEGNITETITELGLNIPKVDIDLSNTEVLVCEVNERREGKTFDFEILQSYWDDWFKRMNVKSFKFIPREQANNITIERIKEFVSN